MTVKKQPVNHVVRKGDALIKVTHQQFVLHLLKAAKMCQKQFGEKWAKETVEKASMVARMPEALCEICNRRQEGVN